MAFNKQSYNSLNQNYYIIQMNKSNKIFDYEVVKKLGEGSFGEVSLATKGGEKFAIKKISKKQVIKV